jgi:voltage-gated potassium channel Kch
VEDAQSHVIIAGFGRFGQIVGRVLNVRKIRFVALDTDAERIAVARRFGNEAYFGDANRLQVLEAAGMDEATALVIAVDDQDRAVEMAQIVKMHFPHVPIYARARDRFHAYRLMDAGVDHVYREMFGSSLDLSEDLLHSLGMPSRQAAEITRRFYDHDQNLMVEQQQGQRDEEALRTSGQAQAQHLQELFVRDLEALDMTEKDSPVPGVNSTSE